MRNKFNQRASSSLAEEHLQLLAEDLQKLVASDEQLSAEEYQQASGEMLSKIQLALENNGLSFEDEKPSPWQTVRHGHILGNVNDYVDNITVLLDSSENPSKVFRIG